MIAGEQSNISCRNSVGSLLLEIAEVMQKCVAGGIAPICGQGWNKRPSESTLVCLKQGSRGEKNKSPNIEQYSSVISSVPF